LIDDDDDDVKDRAAANEYYSRTRPSTLVNTESTLIVQAANDEWWVSVPGPEGSGP